MGRRTDKCRRRVPVRSIPVLQPAHDRAEDEHLAVERHVGHVLHDHGAWASDPDDLQVGLPEVATLVMLLPHTVLHEVSHPGTAGLRERLARRPTRDDVDPRRAEDRTRPPRPVTDHPGPSRRTSRRSGAHGSRAHRRRSRRRRRRCIPACSRPRLIPPAPENRSAASNGGEAGERSRRTNFLSSQPPGSDPGAAPDAGLGLARMASWARPLQESSTAVYEQPPTTMAPEGRDSSVTWTLRRRGPIELPDQSSCHPWLSALT